MQLNLSNIPPTQAALKQHIKRTSYQAYCWNEALTLHPNLPSPADWGWYKDTNCNTWQPLWTNLPEAAESCQVTVNFYVMQFVLFSIIVSAARSLTCRDDLDSKWRLLLAEIIIV